MHKKDGCWAKCSYLSNSRWPPNTRNKILLYQPCSITTTTKKFLDLEAQNLWGQTMLEILIQKEAKRLFFNSFFLVSPLQSSVKRIVRLVRQNFLRPKRGFRCIANLFFVRLIQALPKFTVLHENTKQPIGNQLISRKIVAVIENFSFFDTVYQNYHDFLPTIS